MLSYDCQSPFSYHSLCRLLYDTKCARFHLCSTFRRLTGREERSPSRAGSLGLPVLLIFRLFFRLETIGSLKFLSYPFEFMPCS